MRVSQQLRTPLDISGVLFEAVRGWVSHEALRKVQEQRQLLQEPRQAPCSQTFTSSHGLPCSHTLKKLEETKQSLLLEHFHPHWHLKRDVAQPRPVLEPRRATDQLNQRRTQPATSTRREPSGFEMVEAGKRAPSTCSRCHIVGHIMTSRDCLLKFKDLQAPLSDAMVEVPAEADRRSAPAASRTPLVRLPPPLILDPPIAPHSRAILDCPAGTPPRFATEEPLVDEAPLTRDVPLQSPPRYDSPEAIYGRYVASRNAWYAAQPSGSMKTNQQYRKAMGLPQRYDKQSYAWCLDYKQMSKRCVTLTGLREWMKEEMMAYLDWSNAEDARVEVQVAKELGDNPLANKRRGVKDIWKSVERDSREQQTLHSATDTVEKCIVVKT